MNLYSIYLSKKTTKTQTNNATQTMNTTHYPKKWKSIYHVPHYDGGYQVWSVYYYRDGRMKLRKVIGYTREVPTELPPNAFGLQPGTMR